MDKIQSPPPSPDETPAERAGRRPRRGWWIVLILLVLVALVVWRHPWAPGDGKGAAAGAGQKGRRAAADQPQSVGVGTVVRGPLPIMLNALGTVTPLAGVTVRTQIAGTLTQVAFQEGQTVKKGDFLAQVDPRPYQISLSNAQGTLARDEALLAQARIDLNRYQTLLKQDSIARQQVDTQASLVKQYEGTVRSDRAQVATFQLDLTYCRIVAPITGRVGLRQIDPGNYVQTSDANGIVVITQMQPISVLFSLPEDDLPRVMQRLHAGAALPATAYDRSNTTVLATGSLHTVDNQIDTTTGTIKLRAHFANADGTLFPNQFVNVRLLEDTVPDAVLAPSAGVLTGTVGTYVYLVKPDHTVAVRKVQVGPADAERTSIIAGLVPGDRVVTDGTDRLRDGAKITIPADAPATPASAPAPASGARSTAQTRRHHAASP